MILILAFSMTIAPGPNMFLVLHHVAGGGLTHTSFVIAGICTSLSVHGLIALAGLSLLVNGSHNVLMCVELAGAIYIFYLGTQAILACLRTTKTTCTTQDHTKPLSIRHFSKAFRRGFYTGLLNPYTSMIIITVAPQYLLAGKNHLSLVLGVLIATMVFIKALWFGCPAFAVAKLSQWVRSDAFIHLLSLSSGVALILISINLAKQAFQ